MNKNEKGKTNSDGLIWPVLFPENLPELQPFLEATTTIYDRLGHPIPKIVSHRAMIIVAIKEGLITPSDDLLYFLNLTAQDLVEMGIYSPLHPVNHVKQYNFGGFCTQYVQYADRIYPDRHFADTIKSSIAPSAKFDIELEPNELKAEFLKLYHVKQYNGEMYIFCHNHYRKISQRELTQIIYETLCRDSAHPTLLRTCIENLYATQP